MDNVTVQTNLNHFKHYLKWLGHILAALGIGFVVAKLFQYSEQVHFTQLQPLHFCIVAALSLAYALSNTLLAIAWVNILAHLELIVPFRWAVKTYGISQLSKYIPGNIFHIASRQVIGQAIHLPVKPLMKSSLFELMLLALCGAIYAALTLHGFFSIDSAFSLLLFIILSISIFFIAQLIFSQSLAKATIFYWLFLGCSGVIFVVLIDVFTSPVWTFEFMLLILGSYILAWLVGLVTPGAPAGIGVRETVLWLILQGTIQQSDLITVVIIGRIITSIGDLIFFVMCSSVKTFNWRFLP